MRQPATPPDSGPQAKALDMSVPSHADVIVLNHRPGPALLPGDLMPECRPLRAPGPGEVEVRNLVTRVDPYQLRVVVSEFEGLERAPEALATVFDRGSPYIGRRLALYRQAGRPDLGRVGRGATPARATPGRTPPQP